jgi:hypothetical protein
MNTSGKFPMDVRGRKRRKNKEGKKREVVCSGHPATARVDEVI